jgi:glycogen debranching enzyme
MAYHQGTVWPWLLAQFGEAYLRVAKDRAAARTFLLDYLRSFIRQHIPMAGIGCISEVFDGDPPHRPNGCIAQAWSSAGLIRLYSLLNEKV